MTYSVPSASSILKSETPKHSSVRYAIEIDNFLKVSEHYIDVTQAKVAA